MSAPDPFERLAADQRAFRWAVALRSASWLALTAYLMVVAAQLRRAASVSMSSFRDGVWGQRLEVLSFAALPSNLVAYLMAAAAAIGAHHLAAVTGEAASYGVATLWRAIEMTSYLVLGLAALGIIDEFWQGIDPIDSVAGLLNRGAGALLAAAVVRLGREVNRPA